MKRIWVAALFVSALLSWSCIEALAGVVGTQCWINGKLVGGFPPGYVCPGTGGGSGFSPVPSYDYEAERQRQEAERRRQLEAEQRKQRELDEELKREEDEVNKGRKEEFGRAQKEALDSMKGITENELGLKGTDSGEPGLKDTGDAGTGGLGLKDTFVSSAARPPRKPDCEWGNMRSSVVDLRCLGLDPNRPVFVDPRVVKGKTRGFPAQVDPATFENANYRRGFEALMRFDVVSAAAAVEHFKKATSERPDDPLVRNGLLLAQDILKARQAKEQENQAQARRWVKEGAAALMSEDTEKARACIARAADLDPEIHDIEMYKRIVDMIAKKTGPQSPPETRAAYKLFLHGAYAMAVGDDTGAFRMMEKAHDLAPRDENIAEYLRQIREYREDTESQLKPMDAADILRRNEP